MKRNCPGPVWIAVAGLLHCQLGCGGPKPGDTAVGTYELDKGRSAAVASLQRETLQLNHNNTFTQEIVLQSGKTLRATGKWHAERVAQKELPGGYIIVKDAVWVTLDGLMQIAGGDVIRVTNSFHEIHAAPMTDELWSAEGTNSLVFSRRPR